MIYFFKKTAKKKIRKRQKRQGIEKWFQNHTHALTKIVSITGILVFIIALIILGRSTLFSSKNTIQHVTFAPESMQAYDDPELYTTIEDAVLGRNYYILSWNSLKDIKQSIQEQFPLIRDMSVEQSGISRVYITVMYYEPTLVLRSPSGYTAVYDDTLFSLSSGNTIGHDILTIDIPRYSSGYTSLHGILYAIDENQLVEYITTIKDTLGEKHISEIIYLPGGLKLFVIYKGKKVYFHLDQEVNRQLAKLIDMENWFHDFDNVRVIDVGSIDDIIVR